VEGSSYALISIDRVLTMQSFCIGAAKGKDARFPQTAPTDVAEKSVDCSQASRGVEDLQKQRGDRIGTGLGPA
jgi:hypothetical protein